MVMELLARTLSGQRPQSDMSFKICKFETSSYYKEISGQFPAMFGTSLAVFLETKTGCFFFT